MPDFDMPKGPELASSKVKIKNGLSQKEEPIPVSTQAPKVNDVENKGDKPVFSQDELLMIFDEIIFSGEYTEEVTIKGKLPVKFRTRTAEEINEIQDQLDGCGANLISTVDNLRSLLNLKYALVSFRGKNLNMMKPEERDGFVNKLPGPVVGMLLVALNKFDQKVAAACNEGEANF